MAGSVNHLVHDDSGGEASGIWKLGGTGLEHLSRSYDGLRIQ